MLLESGLGKIYSDCQANTGVVNVFQVYFLESTANLEKISL